MNESLLTSTARRSSFLDTRRAISDMVNSWMFPAALFGGLVRQNRENWLRHRFHLKVASRSTHIAIQNHQEYWHS